MLRTSLVVAAVALAFNAQAQTVKIGMVLTTSGQFADAGNQLLNGAKTYMKMHGDTVNGRKIELITKDTGGVAPDVSKRLSQELIVRDGVDILAGYVLTPNAMAAGDVSAEAKKFMVVMNAATSVVITKSPYMIRTSVTLPQVMETFGTWAATKGGVKQAYTMVTDYGPGIDSETSFQSAFKAAGGSVVGAVRFPVANPDFSAFVQRAKDINPDGVFIFIPGGAQPIAITKAFQERGFKGDKILGQGEITMDDNALKSMGDNALGIRTVFHYSWEHKSKANEAFVKAYEAEFKRHPDVFSIGGWDGMHLIYEALKKTKGKADGDSLIAAAKGMKWESPRGPISIDPATRDIVQNVYIRKVEKVGGGVQNVEVDTIKDEKDPAHPK